jgi:sugar/nucleoside kinase (ribokinase family)
MTTPLNLASIDLSYRVLIGVGGIGSGMVFALEGNRTLGREESRGGQFLDHRDYCKLHIVTHYVASLMDKRFSTHAIGMVGEDETGRRLLREMEAVGISVGYVKRSSASPTLFSFCFNYPDGSGGNLTTNNSASSGVDSATVEQAEPEFREYRGEGIALAVPEVPLKARKSLLELGTEYGFLRVASFTSEEIVIARKWGLLRRIDLVAINQDEAAALLSSTGVGTSLSDTVEHAVSLLSEQNPRLQVVLTAGARGSWSWDGSRLQHIPAIPIALVNGAGAGDAYLAGTLVGLASSLSLGAAQELGNLVAALSATSPHTIHFGVDRDSLASFAQKSEVELSQELKNLLGI